MAEYDYIKQMQDIIDRQTATDSDDETDPQIADAIICACLQNSGQEKLVELFKKIHKWYA